MSVHRKKKTYQYVITEDECQLFNHLRRLDDDIELFAPSNDPRLKQTLKISCEVGGRQLGYLEIDATRLIQDLACAGAEFLQNLLNDDSHEGREEVSDAEHSTNSAKNDDKSVSSSSPDLVSRQQNNLDDIKSDKERTPLWERHRQDLIPPYVKDVTFAIAKEDINSTVEEYLQKNYPGVLISSNLSTLRDTRKDDDVSKEKPYGIKNMRIELDDTELMHRPELEKGLRAHFPWATVQSKPDSQAVTCSAWCVEREEPDEHKFDAVKYMLHLTDYVSKPPHSQEFEVFSSLECEDWATLGPNRRLDLAHARAIQNGYGQAAERGGCKSCSNHGWKCKIYSRILGGSEIQCRQSCQNCLAGGINCDLTRVDDDDQLRIPSETRPKGLGSISYRDGHSQTEQVDRPLRTVATQTLIASLQTNPADKSDDRSVPDPKHESVRSTSSSSFPAPAGRAKSPETGVSISALSTSSILDIADHIGLQMTANVRRIVKSMYTLLDKDGEIKARTKTTPMVHYYNNLITLYILVHFQGRRDLVYIILLRLQQTNYILTGKLPEIEIVVQAFKFLDDGSPLCRWLAILYAYLWGTVEEGSFGKFLETHPHLDRLALSKLLFAVAYVRDPLIMGWDAAVMERWCEVHNHAASALEPIAPCEEMRRGLRTTFQDLKEEYEMRQVKDAQNTLRKLKHLVSDRRTIDSPAPYPPLKREKRKADGSPTQPAQKSRKA